MKPAVDKSRGSGRQVANSHPDLFRTSNHFGCLLHAYPMDGTPQHALFKEKVKGEIRVSSVTSSGLSGKEWEDSHDMWEGSFFWESAATARKTISRIRGGKR